MTYDPDPQLLHECLASITASSYRPLQLVVVDNASRGADVGALIEKELSEHSRDQIAVDFVGQEKNLGYAGATNAGIRACHGEFILLLNPDARVESDTILELVEAAARMPEVAGLAPKILLADPGLVVDSVGMSLHKGGVGGQRGLGQADIGQFDLEEVVPGLCFAAALVRRAAFARNRVGLLDPRHFMFYEDVDWSLRAQVLGERFCTVPTAVVFHFHSATTRHLGGGFKTRLVQRNLIWTAVKNLEARSALKVLLGRSAVNVERALALHHSAASIQAVAEAWIRLPAMMKSRRWVQARRRRADRDFLSHRPERAFFDVNTYRPETTVAALAAALGRLYAVAPRPDLERVLNRVRSAEEAGLGQSRRQVAEMVRESGMPIPPALDWLLGEMASSET